MAIVPRLVGGRTGGLLIASPAHALRVTRLAALAAVLALAACDTPDTCDGRGDSTSYTGFVTYAVEGGAATTESSILDVVDYQQGCTYANEEFPIVVSGCELWLSLTQAPQRRATPTTTAAVEAGQVCQLSLVGRATTLTATGGTLTFANGMVNLVLAGTVASAGTNDAGASASPNALQWSFQATRAAP